MKILLVDPEPSFLQQVQEIIIKVFPDLDLIGMIQNRHQAWKILCEEQPDIVLYSIINIESCTMNRKFQSVVSPKVIYITPDHKVAAETIYLGASGYLLKPLSEVALCRAIYHAISQCESRQSNSDLLSDCIGVPSIEGIDFILKQHIIRLEGLQRCTRIVSQEKGDVISSYSIGIFRSMLDEHIFIQTHKSHLINHRHIRRYLKDGTLIMSDKSTVPVSRRKRSHILSMLNIPDKTSVHESQLPMVGSS